MFYLNDQNIKGGHQKCLPGGAKVANSAIRKWKCNLGTIYMNYQRGSVNESLSNV